MRRERTTNRALMGSGKPDARGTFWFSIKSRQRKGLTHRLAYQPSTARVWCSCEHHTYRHQSRPVSIAEQDLCSHVLTYRTAILKEATNEQI